MKGTLEEKLLKLQEQKRSLVRDILSAADAGKRLTADDFRYLWE